VQALEVGERRLRKHANGMLGFAHTGEERRRIDVTVVVREVVEVMRDLGVAKHVTLGLAIDTQPICVVAEKMELEQV